MPSCFAQAESFKWIVKSNTVFSKTTVEHVKTLEEEEKEEEKKKKRRRRRREEEEKEEEEKG